jgi:hypothetical protein
MRNRYIDDRKINIMETLFEKELAELINKHRKENDSDTPDFILATYLNAVLDNFSAAVKQREEWYGRQKKITDLPEFIPFPTVPPPIIELDNEPIIDLDSTGHPPVYHPPSTIKSSGIDQATTSHKPGIHPLSNELLNNQINDQPE